MEDLFSFLNYYLTTEMQKRVNSHMFKNLCLLLLMGAFWSCSINNDTPLEEFVDDPTQEELVLTDEATAVASGVTCSDLNPRLYTWSYVSSSGTDIGATVNSTIDDRTCTANYSQRMDGGRLKGVYKIKAGSNHIDNLQPRIERASPVVSSNGGSYVRFSGYVTIKRAGHKSDSWPREDMRDASGTYIAQAKGKHTGGGGSPDPAIALIVAKPRFSGGTQVSYDLYREQIKYRGGSGVNGRELVFLTNIPANTRRFFRMETGFTGSGSSKTHYVNVRIGGTDYNWNVPDPQRGTQAKMRFGAYRCKGGEAEILWDGVNETHVSN